MRLLHSYLLPFSPALRRRTRQDILEAAKKGKNAEVEQLLAKGADLESQDRDGRTPLMLAAQYGHDRHRPPAAR